MTDCPVEIDIDQPLPIVCIDQDDNIIDGGHNLDLPKEYLHQNGITHHALGSNNNTTITNHNDIKSTLKPAQNGNESEAKLNLPKVSFRQLPMAPYMKKTHTAKAATQKKKNKISQDNYYHYEEPSPEELFKQIEYDMDLEDLHWLQTFNKTIGAKNRFRLSEAEFEKIMDRLEKESYFDNMKSGRTAGPVVDEDAVCAICNDGECNNANVILFCDLCDLAVHQECYGVPYVPEGQWLCRRCLKSPMRNVECCLCPNLGGAFKQTDDNRWAHVICALWIPEVCFANTVFLEPIDSIQQIPQARWKLSCYICKQKKRGACIQCQKANCYQSFHVTCAQQAGIYMKISTCKYPSPDGGTFTDVKKEAFCHMHGPPGSKRKKGCGMYSGDETDEDVETESYRKKSMMRKKEIRKARKLLAEQREEFKTKDTAIVKVDDQKLIQISNLLGNRGRKLAINKFRQIRIEYIKNIHAYWQLKRNARNGVPLLRRLQVSFNGSTSRPASLDLDVDKYTKLRYDLEKCRLLVGEVKKREVAKRRIVQLNKQIIDLTLKTIDMDLPPPCFETTNETEAKKQQHAHPCQ